MYYETKEGWCLCNHNTWPPLWSRGNIIASHVADPGLIPGQLSFPGLVFFQGFFYTIVKQISEKLRPRPSLDIIGHHNHKKIYKIIHYEHQWSLMLTHCKTSYILILIPTHIVNAIFLQVLRGGEVIYFVTILCISSMCFIKYFLFYTVTDQVGEREMSSIVCVPMPTHCIITRFGFHARWIDGVKCGLFSNHASLRQTTLRVEWVSVKCTGESWG